MRIYAEKMKLTRTKELCTK